MSRQMISRFEVVAYNLPSRGLLAFSSSSALRPLLSTLARIFATLAHVEPTRLNLRRLAGGPLFGDYFVWHGRSSRLDLLCRPPGHRLPCYQSPGGYFTSSMSLLRLTIFRSLLSCAFICNEKLEPLTFFIELWRPSKLSSSSGLRTSVLSTVSAKFKSI